MASPYAGYHVQLVETSMGDATFDGCVSTTHFWHRVLHSCVQQRVPSVSIRAAISKIYKSDAAHAGPSHATIDEIIILLTVVFEKVARKFPHNVLPPVALIVDWSALDVRLNDDIVKAVARRRDEHLKKQHEMEQTYLKRKREIEQGLLEYEEVLTKRLKKED